MNIGQQAPAQPLAPAAKPSARPPEESRGNGAVVVGNGHTGLAEAKQSARTRGEIQNGAAAAKQSARTRHESQNGAVVIGNGHTSLTGSNGMDKAAAATKLQSLHRGRSSRKMIQSKRAELAAKRREVAELEQAVAEADAAGDLSPLCYLYTFQCFCRKHNCLLSIHCT